jgi:hypothetical protein
LTQKRQRANERKALQDESIGTPTTVPAGYQALKSEKRTQETIKRYATTWGFVTTNTFWTKQNN